MCVCLCVCVYYCMVSLQRPGLAVPSNTKHFFLLRYLNVAWPQVCYRARTRTRGENGSKMEDNSSTEKTHVFNNLIEMLEASCRAVRNSALCIILHSMK